MAKSSARDSKLNLTSKNAKGKRQNSQLASKVQTTEAKLEATYCQNTNSSMLEKVEKRRSNFNVKLDKRFNKQTTGVNSGDELLQSSTYK